MPALSPAELAWYVTGRFYVAPDGTLGLAGNSGHALSPSRVSGLVVTAFWRSDGRLGYVAGARTPYR